MVKMDVYLDTDLLRKLAEFAKKIPLEDGMPNTKTAVSDSAYLLRNKWRSWAMGGEIAGIPNNKNPSAKLSGSIVRTKNGRFDYLIASESMAARKIHEGCAELDMKKTHPYGKNSRVSKKGVPYLIIPFRWGTPNDKGGRRAHWKNFIPQTIHEKLKEIKIQKSFTTGVTHLEPNARGEQVERDEYTWKDRIQTDGDLGNMSGMVRMEDKASKNGSTYFTFRIISKNSPAGSWIRKRIEPIDVPGAVAKESKAEVEKIIEKGVVGDIGLF